jgi:LuxR family transcriptional regulator, maltose regulon positive regulatory protein
MLGGFRIECDGQPADHTRSDAARGLRLFKCLLSRNPRQIGREQAYERFWPDSKPEAVSTSFRGSIFDFRRMLEPDLNPDASIIVVSRDLVSIRATADLWVDADAFEARAEQALRSETPDIALLKAADQLYTGDFLPDDLYDEWAT